MIAVSISIVTYFPDRVEFDQVIVHLYAAVNQARHSLNGILGEVRLSIVDNSCNNAVFEWIRSCLDSHKEKFSGIITVVNSGENIGFGAGHNLAIAKEKSTYHLVLNPDVLLEPVALSAAIRFMQDHPSIGLLAPRVVKPGGEASYLCRRYPSVLNLVLRGFSPGWIQRHFRKQLHHYEMRDVTQSETEMNIPIASGCFMFFRTEVLKRLGGFDVGYFLYFEDYDLCMRISGIAGIAYVPAVCITHSGGDAARKGHRHIAMFVRSAVRFFSRWGWKWW